MDEETKQKIAAFSAHLRSVHTDIIDEMPATAEDIRIAALLILELTEAIDLEGMRFGLKTKLPQ